MPYIGKYLEIDLSMIVDTVKEKINWDPLSQLLRVKLHGKDEPVELQTQWEKLLGISDKGFWEWLIKVLPALDGSKGFDAAKWSKFGSGLRDLFINKKEGLWLLCDPENTSDSSHGPIFVCLLACAIDLSLLMRPLKEGWKASSRESV